MRVASLQWTEKYAPEGIDEVIGNPSAIAELRNWATNWNPGKKPLLLVGPPGTGKTASAIAIAKTMGWEILEMNASDQRNKQNVEHVAGLASVSATFSGGKRLILFDEIDGMLKEDRGGASAVVKVIKESRNPIILTANDEYANSLKTIRQYCKVVKFKKIHYGTIKNRLKEICLAEGMDFDEKALIELAKRASGDLKSAINDLQAISDGKITLESLNTLGLRDTRSSIFNALIRIFKKKSFTEARETFLSCDEDPNLFFKWVEENTPRGYSDEELAKVLENLALADIFANRIIKRQAWNLMKYQIDLMTAGVSLANSCGGYTAYQFPSVIKKLSSSKLKRSVRDSLASKISKKLHTSKKEFITEYLHYFRELFKKDPIGYAKLFNLDEKELIYLGVDQRRAKEIITSL